MEVPTADRERFLAAFNHLKECAERTDRAREEMKTKHQVFVQIAIQAMEAPADLSLEHWAPDRARVAAEAMRDVGALHMEMSYALSAQAAALDAVSAEAASLIELVRAQEPT